MKLKNRMAAVILFCCPLLLSSCFDTHPYDVNFKGELGINRKQIEVIQTKFADKDTLRVAFISDSHFWLSDLCDEVEDLNRRTDIDFVIHCGDLTQTGMAKEFELSRDILLNLRYPFVVLIGNHDFLGTGAQSYEVMYGDIDFSFIAGGVKFVCLNTNATEYDYLAAVPNFDFMEQEMVRDSALSDLYGDGLMFYAIDSIYVKEVPESKYDERVLRYRKHWAALIPTRFVIQNAGNMGQLSAGIGWGYGGLFSFEPLTTSLYVNTVYGHEFWKSQPGRYPDKYYRLTSTKFRLNIALGQLSSAEGHDRTFDRN